MKNLAAKLLEVQKEVGAIKKDSVNPFFKSKYADINSYIDTVKPILNKHGVVLLQPLSHIGYYVPGEQGAQGYIVAALKTILIDADSGESVEDIIPLPRSAFSHKEINGKDKAGNPVKEITDKFDPQTDGSTITYYRRYALQSMLFLQAEDDDGNVAAGKKTDQPDEDF
jgi:hypothetical protein